MKQEIINLLKVVHMGVAAMLILASRKSLSIIAKNYVEAVKEEDESLTLDGYQSSRDIFIMYIFTSFFSPLFMHSFGLNNCIRFGALTNLTLTLSFFYLKPWLFHTASLLAGFGYSLLLPSMAVLLNKYTTVETVHKHAGIFWLLRQSSLLVGNGFMIFKMEGKEVFDKDTRNVCIVALSIASGAGFLATLTMTRPPSDPEAREPVNGWEETVEIFYGMLKLLVTKRMALMTITFFHIGCLQCFYSGIYSSCIGFTKAFPGRKGFLPWSGFLVGAGAVTGGALSGLLGKAFGKKLKLSLAAVICGSCYGAIAVNLPQDSPFHDTDSSALLKSNLIVALTCSFFLGLADSLYVTQAFAIIKIRYPGKSRECYAVFKTFQSIAAAFCYGFASRLDLYFQLGILSILLIFGTWSFLYVDRQFTKESNINVIH